MTQSLGPRKRRHKAKSARQKKSAFYIDHVNNLSCTNQCLSPKRVNSPVSQGIPKRYKRKLKNKKPASAASRQTQRLQNLNEIYNNESPITSMLSEAIAYDNRPVNSIDSGSIYKYYLGEPNYVQRIRRRRKPELIDSEVDLFKKRERRLIRIPNRLLTANLTNKRIRLTEQYKINQQYRMEQQYKLDQQFNVNPFKESTPFKVNHKFRTNQHQYFLMNKDSMRKAHKNLKRANEKVTITIGSDEDNATPLAKSFTYPITIMDMSQQTSCTDPGVKYPVLNDQQLIQRFLGVALTNNQKGRLRQVLKQIFSGASPAVLPEVINNKIQTILRSNTDLTDTDLRKIRILYNMLKSAISNEERQKQTDSVKEEAQKENEKTKKEVKKRQKEPKKINNNKRYIVFVGNLKKDITKEEILEHFAELRDYIKDIRIPRSEDKKSAIAYVELTTEPSYEMALSKHHTMLCNRRINVLYSAPKKGKVLKADAKAKTSKLVAMVKSGQLTGSIPLAKKRSHRRAILKQHRKAEESSN